MQKLRLVIFIFLLLPLVGCGRSIVNDVTTFHNLPAPDGETIEVVALHPEQQKSLEFGQYAELVGQRLGAAGYRPPQGAPAEYIARIGYGMRAVEGVVDQGPRSSVSVGVGGGSHHTSVGMGMAFPLGRQEMKQDYIRFFTLEIFHRSDDRKLYESRVESRGRESLAIVMPYLVEALFQDFPGESGTTKKVKITP